MLSSRELIKKYSGSIVGVHLSEDPLGPEFRQISQHVPA